MDYEQLREEQEWRRCENDEQYFLETYWHIRVPGGKQLFRLREPQKIALQTWNECDYTISLKARQIGWTTLASAHAFYNAYFHPDRQIIALSRNERYARKLLAMCNYGRRWLPKWMQDRGPQVERDNLLELVFDNGSAIESLPSRENAARGETSYMIIVDEWAFFFDPEGAWAAIEPATDVGGRIIGISTGNGYGNWFHRFYEAAKAGQNQFTSMFFSWQAVPGRDEAWYNSKTRNMEPWQISQEYPTTDEEAFIASGDPVYDTAMLKERIEELPPLHEGELRRRSKDEIKLVDIAESPLRIWELPQPGMTYAVGADVGSGVPEGDYSTATVIKVDTGKIVAVYQERVVPEDFAEDLDLLGRFFNDALMGIERNSHGLTVVRLVLHELEYPNFYFHIRENAQRTRTRTPGWITNSTTKPLMVNELGASLRRGRLILHCAETKAELIQFSRKRSKNGAEQYGGKPHDDLVISLAIANMMMSELEGQPAEEEEEPGGYNLAFLERLLQQAQSVPGRHYTAGYTPPKSSGGPFVVHV